MDNKVVETGVIVHDRMEAISLIHDGNRCSGVVARCLKTGELIVYLARSTLIATGGYGRIYRETTNALINDGGGAIIALDTGIVPIGNPEAVQFHRLLLEAADPQHLLQEQQPVFACQWWRGRSHALSNVDVSPSGSPSSRALSSRRMILPLRVFGKCG